MGKQSIYEFLKKNHSKWYTSKDIAKGLNLSTSSISTSLMRLRKGKGIYFKQNPERRNTFLYKVEES